MTAILRKTPKASLFPQGEATALEGPTKGFKQKRTPRTSRVKRNKRTHQKRYRIRTRVLEWGDGDKLAALRLEALAGSGENYFSKIFGFTLDEAKKFSDAKWRRLSQNRADRFVIGMFECTGTKDKCIGIAAAVQWKNSRPRQNPRYRIAYFTSAYITPEYRGAGLGWKLNKARLAEAKKRGFSHALLCIRAGNLASERIHKGGGARFIHSRQTRWSNNETAPGLWYVTSLRNKLKKPPLPKFPHRSKIAVLA